MGEEAAVGMADLLTGGTQLLTWIVSSMSKITAWALADDLAFTYLSVFLVSVTVGFLFRILRSV